MTIPQELTRPDHPAIRCAERDVPGTMRAVQFEKVPAGRLDRSLLAAGFALGIVGGLILAASYIADLPTEVLAAGWLAFVVGVAMAFVFGLRDARREGRSVWSSLGEGLRTLWSFLCAFMP